MILGLASVAYAASFSDTAGNARETAIKRLAGLGLLNGYPDGSFRPGNPITRAEFAKVIVYAMGLKDAAAMLGGVPVGFTDVQANHWASGFVSIAASQGVIKGYPDGTFRPEANVTYAEALTMILRAIGYEPVLQNGTWPTVYLTKAAELKINKGISFNASTNATRGDVAGLLANAVTVAKLIQVSFGDSGKKYVVSGTDGTKAVYLLTDMGATSEEGWLVSSPDLFSNDGKKIKVDGKDTRTLEDGTECSGLLGHKVRLWLNTDSKVFFVEDLSSAESVQAASYVDSDTVKIKSTKKKYDMTGSVMFRNYGDLAAINVVDGDELTVIFDGDTPKYVVALAYKWGVVDSVSASYKRIAFSDPIGSLILKDHKTVTWKGAASSFDDLAKKDVVQYINDASAQKARLIVTRNSVSGSFSKLSGDTVTIGGTDYTKVSDAVGIESGKLGKDVSVLLNKDGEIVKMGTTSATASSTYAAILEKGAYNDGFSTVYKFRLLNGDGSTAVLNLASTVTYNGGSPAITAAAAAGNVSPADVISYKTNSSGAISSLDLKVAYSAHTTPCNIDKDYSLIAFGGSSYKVTADTVVFDMTSWYAKGGPPNPTPPPAGGTATKDDIVLGTAEGLLTNSSIRGAVSNDSGKATAVAITTGTSGSSYLFGAVAGKYQTVINSDVKWVVRVLVDGTVTDYTTDLNDTDAGNLAKKDIIRYHKLASGKIGSISEPAAVAVSDATYGEFRISSIDTTNNLLTIQEYHKTTGAKIGGSLYYYVNSKTVYYDATGSSPASRTLADLSKFMKVELYVTGSVVNALKILAD